MKSDPNRMAYALLSLDHVLLPVIHVMKSISKLSIAAFFVLSASSPVNAALIVDIKNGSAQTCSTGCANGTTYGYQFSLSSSISVDGMGVWDAGADGLGRASVGVGLWNTAGTLLASSTVATDATLETSAGAGGWRMSDISSLTLDAGDYVLGSVFFNPAPHGQTNPSMITIPELTVTGSTSLAGAADAGLSFPSVSVGFLIVGPTLRLVEAAEPPAGPIPGPSAAVPEPSVLALMGTGFAAFGFVRRRKQ